MVYIAQYNWCRKLQWTMTITKTHLLVQESGMQQKLRRGFKQNSVKCLQTFSSQNVSRHQPSAGINSPLIPWQKCLSLHVHPVLYSSYVECFTIGVAHTQETLTLPKHLFLPLTVRVCRCWPCYLNIPLFCIPPIWLQSTSSMPIWNLNRGGGGQLFKNLLTLGIMLKRMIASKNVKCKFLQNLTRKLQNSRKKINN